MSHGDVDGWSDETIDRYPLHYWADRGEVDRLQTTLAGGVLPDGLDEDEWTPLMWARTPEAVEVLLQAGANPLHETLEGESVLMALARRASPQALSHFVKATEVNVDSTDGRGNTALMEAASVGAEANVAVLLSYGADAGAAAHGGGTAESAARDSGYQQLADRLRDTS